MCQHGDYSLSLRAFVVKQSVVTSKLWWCVSAGHSVCAGGPSEAAGPSRALRAGGRPASSRAALP